MSRTQDDVQPNIRCLHCKSLIIFPCHRCWPGICVRNNSAVSCRTRQETLRKMLPWNHIICCDGERGAGERAILQETSEPILSVNLTQTYICRIGSSSQITRWIQIIIPNHQVIFFTSEKSPDLFHGQNLRRIRPIQRHNSSWEGFLPRQHRAAARPQELLQPGRQHRLQPLLGPKAITRVEPHQKRQYPNNSHLTGHMFHSFLIFQLWNCPTQNQQIANLSKPQIGIHPINKCNISSSSGCWLQALAGISSIPTCTGPGNSSSTSISTASKNAKVTSARTSKTLPRKPGRSWTRDYNAIYIYSHPQIDGKVNPY